MDPEAIKKSAKDHGDKLSYALMYPKAVQLCKYFSAVCVHSQLFVFLRE